VLTLLTQCFSIIDKQDNNIKKDDKMRDVLQFAKTEMKQGETESTQVVVNNYQIQEEDGRTYYEIYE